ncbi:hypothetical protein HIM_05141 [Hirsutella minnesotensis 3608]|uniref:NADPH-dependent 1-acyldihydroxyacetone phosphate reductase n=1 Tax=Hirsutella minnesotensis 3608 TaxID=1043627 RepID=A0A0F7ZPG2_9HYPO|nr:hypothetical protein HIM_05141 [Hirsutella minnesotensis 3608]
MGSKTVLVTGCSGGGIGASIALALANRGHHVFASARSISRIPQQLSELSNVTLLTLDVTSPRSIIAAEQAVVDSGRELDILINNAGAGYSMPVLDIDIDQAKQVYEVNVWGVLRTTQIFAKQLIRNKGRVVNISTCGAVLNTPWISSYSSSKAALTCMSETMRLELSPFGVSVVTIMAGIITTHFHDNEAAFHLGETSRYAFIEDIIATWASGQAKPKGTPPDLFAEQIVEDIVKSTKTGLLWRGAHAGMSRFVATWLPRTVRDALMCTGQGLKELAEYLRQGS